MNNTDRFYIEGASGAISQLFEVHGDEPPYILDSDERKYLDPIAFEKHIKKLQSQLWPVEFRKAYATINEYLQRASTENFIDALNMAAISMQALSAVYCPEMTDELAKNYNPKIDKRKPVIFCHNMPKELANNEAQSIFAALETAGYLDSKGQPTNSAKSQAVRAYMAHSIAQLLGLQYWAKVFHEFWRTKNLPQSLNQITTGKEYTAKIDRALADAVNKNTQLKATEKGKELLRKYKNQIM